MNPTLELEEVVSNTLRDLAIQGELVDSPAEIATYVSRSIRDWMSRNEMVFYQP